MSTQKKIRSAQKNITAKLKQIQSQNSSKSQANYRSTLVDLEQVNKPTSQQADACADIFPRCSLLKSKEHQALAHMREFLTDVLRNYLFEKDNCDSKSSRNYGERKTHKQCRVEGDRVEREDFFQARKCLNVGLDNRRHIPKDTHDH